MPRARRVGDSGRDQKLIRTIARKGFALSAMFDCRASVPRLARDSAISRTRFRRSPSPARPAAIAVLPFANMSEEPSRNIFRRHQRRHHNSAVEIALVLCDRAQLVVYIQGQGGADLNQIGEELGVGYVVEAACERKAIACASPRTHDVSTGSHIWAERYDRNIADVFAVQDEITEAIVGAIEPQLYAAENFRAQRKAPDSMDAWDLVMRGLSHYWRLTRQTTWSRKRCSKRRQLSIRIMVRRLACLQAATHSALTWVGRTWQLRCCLPNVPPWRRSVPIARTPGPTTLWAMSTCSRAASTIRSPNSNWPAAQSRFFAGAGFHGFTLPIAAGGRTDLAARLRCGSVRAIPSPRSTWHRRLRAVHRP